MVAKVFVGLVAAAGLGLTGVSFAPKPAAAGGSCCYPGAECCFDGSPCCPAEPAADGCPCGVCDCGTCGCDAK